MARVYLETSFVSACVTDRKDAGSVYRREKSLEWWAFESQRHEICSSGEVVLELSDPRYRRRDEAIQFIHGIPLLPVNQQVLDLAVAAAAVAIVVLIVVRALRRRGPASTGIDDDRRATGPDPASDAIGRSATPDPADRG